MKRICVIGTCGHVERALRTVLARKNTVVCGIAPGSPHESVAPRLAAFPYFSDYREMLDRERPELAIVSPVFGLTSAVIADCAARGISVFSEKPVATDTEELERIEKAVSESGIRFCAMHYLRYEPAFYHGAELVRKGAIGEIRMITAQKSYKYGNRPAWYADRSLFGGTIPWVGIHAIDWIYHFSGKRFRSVLANAVGDSPETAAACLFTLEDGVIASLHLDYHRPASAPTHGDDRIRAVGSKGVLEIRDGRILLIGENAEETIEPPAAPELFEEFLNGGDPIPREEIFYLTRVALLARESADRREPVAIE